MEIIKLNSDFPKDLHKEFLKYEVYSNYSRLRLLAMLLLLISFLLILTDYNNYQKNLWDVRFGYQLLFYSHVVLMLGMGLLTSLYWKTKLYSIENVRWNHKAYEICFASFLLLVGAVISGWIDQLIHGQLTVYIMMCFIVAMFFHLEPKVSLGIYLSSYIILMLGITWQQNNSEVLNAHYINTSFLIIASWFLSYILYKSRIQDFSYRNHLEQLVQERTKELEGTNHQLRMEVSERNKIEAKIFRLASIVESTNDGIIGMTLDGTIIDWNRGAESIYGYSEKEIMGSSASKLFPPDRKLELDDILLTVSQGKSVSHYDTIRQRKDGEIIDVDLTVSPIMNHNGKITGASTIIRDVTAQRIIEKEMKRMDQMNLVGEMAASIGHEVRNPMTTVRGFLQLLGKKKNSAKYSDYIPLMISELDRANHIITEFLAISRTKVTEVAPHNLNDIINSILPLVHVEAIRYDKHITTQLGIVPDLVLDEKEMRQMILNLSRNGIEAMDKGGGLSIKTLVEDDQVILAIQDEGTGIKPEIIHRLGTPFFTTKEAGTGLGLAVCYGIAERHNAIITIDSSPKGSTFFVKFKALIAHNEAS